MKHKTYQILREAHLGNVDKLALLEAKETERDKFHRNLIDLMLDPKAFRVPWDILAFTTQFRHVSPRERKDETVFAFLLRLATLVKEEAYIRTFQKPESHDALLAWVQILRSTIQCTLALLYKVQWNSPEAFGHLEEALLKLLSTGDELALRTLMQQLGIELAKESPYPAEAIFEKMNLLHVVQWSGFTWRFLHWMAEAVTFQSDADLFYWKKMWREILTGPFYRTLRCSVCSVHFHAMVEKHKEDLLAGHLPTILFDMHNQVHAERRDQIPSLKEPDYTEAEYKEDVEFMVKGLEGTFEATI